MTCKDKHRPNIWATNNFNRSKAGQIKTIRGTGIYQNLVDSCKAEAF